MSAAIGFIALFGQAVLNGVVMVSYFNQLREAGTPLLDAVRQGAVVRLRTVLMTALLAMLGLLPMALSHGIGSETQRPLAVVIIGGLVSATLLTLIVLPTLYVTFAGDRGPSCVRRLRALLAICAVGIGAAACYRVIPAGSAAVTPITGVVEAVDAEALALRHKSGQRIRIALVRDTAVIDDATSPAAVGRHRGRHADRRGLSLVAGHVAVADEVRLFRPPIKPAT